MDDQTIIYHIKLLLKSGLILITGAIRSALLALPSAEHLRSAQILGEDIICLYDYDNDGFISPNGNKELMKVGTAEECRAIGGAVTYQLPNNIVRQYERAVSNARSIFHIQRALRNIDKSNQISYKARRLEPISSNASSQTNSSSSEGSTYSSTVIQSSSLGSTESMTSISSSDSSVTLSEDSGIYPIDSINGPMNGQLSGGKIPSSDLRRIRSRIGPPLLGKDYLDTEDDETTFNCQDFTEVAENAFRDLTYARISCNLFCERKLRIPIIRRRYKVVGGYGHSFLDYHKGKFIYFIEPQSANYSELEQFDLDLNDDGKIESVELSQIDGVEQNILNFFDTKKCKPDRTYVTCRIYSFDDRQKAYEWSEIYAPGSMSPPKLPR